MFLNSREGSLLVLVVVNVHTLPSIKGPLEPEYTSVPGTRRFPKVKEGEGEFGVP